MDARQEPLTPEAGRDLLSVGEVAERTGLSPDTLRVWERRFGRPRPLRLPSGHRRYTASEARWLQRVAEALAYGFRPKRVLALEETELDALLASAMPSLPTTTDAAVSRWLEDLQAARLDELEAGLAEGLGDAPDHEVLDGPVTAFLHGVGRLWADGELAVHHEHLATALLDRLLRTRRLVSDVASLRARQATGEGQAPVVLSTLPGDRHGVALQMLALCCDRRGVPVVELGVDTPLEDIVTTAEAVRPMAVGVSVSLAVTGPHVDHALGDLAGQLGSLCPLLAGGAGVTRRRRMPRGVGRLPSLRAFDGWLAVRVPSDG